MTPIDEAAVRDAVAPIMEFVGWATVDLDRAEWEVAGHDSPIVWNVPRDPHLGAHCRLLVFHNDRRVVLLEPDTEGRLAASLARFGEGAAVTYLLAEAAAADRARAAGLTLSTEADGPLGRQWLVVGGRVWGPHLVIVTAAQSRAATIRL